MDDGRAAWAAHVTTHREIDGRRWRVSDPRIPEELRQRLVDELMAAWRAVKAAGDDEAAERAARDRVHDAKVALGERGVQWWDAEPDPAQADDRVHRAARALGRSASDGTADVDDVAAAVTRTADEIRAVLDAT